MKMHGTKMQYVPAERTCPVYQKTCLGYAADGTANGPVHTCFGNGGYALSWFVRPFVSNVRPARYKRL